MTACVRKGHIPIICCASWSLRSSSLPQACNVDGALGERVGRKMMIDGLELTAVGVLTFYIPHLAALFVAWPGYRGWRLEAGLVRGRGMRASRLSLLPPNGFQYLIWPQLEHMIATSKPSLRRLDSSLEHNSKSTEMSTSILFLIHRQQKSFD